ncbi:Smr/MutS family protein [Sphingomonas sp.]|uniref:Smr/MutS family protein n=1 Tax=Sphingomonas sp. TaxID=28214 RepID=UPI0035BC29DE
MAGRSLHPDEAQLWARVMASVRPLRPVAVPKRAAPTPPAPVAPPAQTTLKSLPSRQLPTSRPVPGVTLDGGWDRRLTRGAVQPDASLDLHGHTLASAHALLDAGLDRAIARGDRVLLLVTGKPPRAESERPHARGAIRAAVADWLAVSRHAGAIAAVRGAHPRHGGTGALYIVLRRTR